MGKSKKEIIKARQVRISNYALQRINEIINYITFDNQQPLNAAKVSIEIERTIAKIPGNPFAYKECEQLATKTKIYRQVACLSWLILYKITSTEIIILSVIHGARNPSKLKKLRKIK